MVIGNGDQRPGLLKLGFLEKVFLGDVETALPYIPAASSQLNTFLHISRERFKLAKWRAPSLQLIA